MRRDARIVPRFARDAFGPGETVEGVLDVIEPVDGVRRLDGRLEYVDRSPSFSGAVTAAATTLHDGPVQPGGQIPFAFQLPVNALPNWDHPATAELGTLSWALVLQADVAAGLDTTTTHDVPVARDAVWPGFGSADGAAVKESGGGWDVTIAPDRWSLRRGETVAVDVSIAEPEAGRDTLRVGLMCQADSDVETTSTTSGGDTSHRRETRTKTLYEVWPDVDTTLGRQTIELELPADGPFSYDGSAFGFRWFVLAREAKRLRSDPHRSARLHVLP